MRFQQVLAVVALTIFFTLLVTGRSGCNPFAGTATRSTSRTEQRNPERKGARPQRDGTDTVRFDDTLVTHYAPDENLERVDTGLLATAAQTLDVAAYSLTDFALRDALIAAAQRGVTVRIYVDKVQSEEEDRRDDSVLQALAATPHITVAIKHSAVLMHLKSYAIDGTTLRSGSANFSPTGEKRQDNDLTVTRNPVAVQAFERHFDEMWARPDNDSVR